VGAIARRVAELERPSMDAIGNDADLICGNAACFKGSPGESGSTEDVVRQFALLLPLDEVGFAYRDLGLVDEACIVRIAGHFRQV
jgi:hypothetical protein